jgi:hypothetical protein
MAAPAKKKEPTWEELVLKNQKDTAAAQARLQRELPGYRNVVDPKSKVTTAKRIENTRRAVKLHGEPYRAVIEQVAKKRNVPADWLLGIFSVEQQGNEKYGDYKASSRAGAKGPFQITDEMAKKFNINRDDVASSADGTAQVLAELRDRLGTTDPLVLGAMYNAGDRIVRQYGGDANTQLPIETQQYTAALQVALEELANTPKQPQGAREVIRYLLGPSMSSALEGLFDKNKQGSKP